MLDERLPHECISSPTRRPGHQEYRDGHGQRYGHADGNPDLFPGAC